MSKLTWLSNTADPKNARFDPREPYDWYRDKIIGRPKASEKYSVEELEAMGMVGVYKETDDEVARRNP